MYKHFIWDFDGTLFNTYPMIIEIHRQILLEYGINEDMNMILKVIKEKSSKEVLEYYNKKYNITHEMFRKKYFDKDHEAEYEKLSEPQEGVIDVCKYIKEKGYKNYIVSNRDRSILRLLENHEILQYFDDIIYAEEFKKKPSEEMFVYIIEKHNMNKEEVLSIGDRNLDFVPSTKVGIDTCLYKPFSEKLDCSPRYVIDSMKELYDIIT
ncbi:MAG TPA: hypothetical protein DEP72_00640 [Clostridiales bacterium]|nr:MAG: hypothetical protein A2Y18_02940 [Clostridiales bacterium GWD2_32_19]HCC06659.1 hypothetical protein [Clostridiales bacterium]